MIILITVFCVAFALLAWKRLEWALLALALLLPSYLIRFSIAGLPLTLLEAMILVAFAVWVAKNIKVLRTAGAKTPYPFRWAAIAWLLISFASVSVAGWSMGALGIWRAYFFEPLLLFIVVVNVINTKAKTLNLIKALGISAAAISAFALYQYATGDFIPNASWAAAEGRRATSFFPYPNAIGLYLAPIMFLLSGAWYAAWAKTKNIFSAEALAWLAGIFLCLAGIVAAKSEGAAFGAAAGFIAFGLIADKKLRMFTIAVLAVGMLSLAAAAPLREYVVKRVTLENFSGQVRRAQWKETIIMLRDGRLLQGAGLDSYQSAVKPYHQEGIFVKNDDPDFQRKVVFNAEYRAQVWQPLEIYLYPHNFILNFWSELGLAGVLGFAWLAALYFYYGISAYRRAKKEQDSFAYVILGLTLSLAVMLVHGLVDVPYFKNDLAALFWIMFGLMAVIHVRSRNGFKE